MDLSQKYMMNTSRKWTWHHILWWIWPRP
jgi:hypothetical protein